jgi:hypothetical protein
MDPEFFLGKAGYMNTFFEAFKPPFICSYCRYGDLCYSPEVNQMYPLEKTQVLINASRLGKCVFAEGINYLHGLVFRQIHRIGDKAVWETVKTSGEKDAQACSIEATRRNEAIPVICRRCFFQKNNGECINGEIKMNAKDRRKSVFEVMWRKDHQGYCQSGALHNPNNPLFNWLGFEQILIREGTKVRQFNSKR